METKGHLEVEALEALPLLPLPEYTLFPHTLVPFHVFEPRYRQLVARARQREPPTFAMAGPGSYRPGPVGHVFARPVADTGVMVMLCYKNGSLVREAVRDRAGLPASVSSLMFRCHRIHPPFLQA